MYFGDTCAYCGLMQHTRDSRHFSRDPAVVWGHARSAVEMKVRPGPAAMLHWSEQIGLYWSPPYAAVVAAVAAYLAEWDGELNYEDCRH